MSESIDRAGWDRADRVCLCQAEAGRRSSCSRRRSRGSSGAVVRGPHQFEDRTGDRTGPPI